MASSTNDYFRRFMDAKLGDYMDTPATQFGRSGEDVGERQFVATTTSTGVSSVGDVVVPVGPSESSTVYVKGGEIAGVNVPIGEDAPAPVISANQAAARISAEARSHRISLISNAHSAREASRRWFALMLSFVSIGSIAIICGIAMCFLGKIEAGVVTGICGALMDFGGAIFFKKDTELRKVVEKNQRFLESMDKLLTVFEMAETIGDLEERDNQKALIIGRALGIGGNDEPDT